MRGHSEKIIGAHLGHDREKRDRVVIATKFSGNLYPGDPNGGGSSRNAIVASCEHSLRRLWTDYIDLYYLHIWDKHTPIEETLRGWAPLIALQIEYSLAERTVEGELIPMARELGLGVVPWSPLAGGRLSGRYTRGNRAAPSERAEPRAIGGAAIAASAIATIGVANHQAIDPDHAGLASSSTGLVIAADRERDRARDRRRDLRPPPLAPASPSTAR